MREEAALRRVPSEADRPPVPTTCRPAAGPPATQERAGRWLRLAPGLACLLLALVSVSVMAAEVPAIFTPAKEVSLDAVKAKYERYASLLTEVDPQAAIHVSELLEVAPEEFPALSKADWFTSTDPSVLKSNDTFVDPELQDGGALVRTIARWHPRPKSQRPDLAAWPARRTLQFDVDRITAKHPSLGLRPVAGQVVSVESRILSHAETHTALVLWFENPQGDVFFHLLDPILVTVSLAEANRATTFEAARKKIAFSDSARSLEKANNLVCRPRVNNTEVFDNDPAKWHMSGDLRFHDSMLMLRHVDQWHAGSSHGHEGHLFKPVVKCDCTSTCSTATDMIFTSQVGDEVGAVVDDFATHDPNHGWPEKVAMAQQPFAVNPGQGGAVFVVAGLGFAVQACELLDPLFCYDEYNLQVPGMEFSGVNVSGGIGGFSASVNLNYNTDATIKKMKGVLAYECPPCQKLWRASGTVTGLEAGEEIRLRVVFLADPKVDSETTDEVEVRVVQSNSTGTVPFTTNQVIPEAGSQTQPVEFIPLTPGGAPHPHCERTSDILSNGNLEGVHIDCSGTVQPPSDEFKARVHFLHWKNESYEGSAQLTLTGVSNGQSQSFPPQVVTGPTGTPVTVTFPADLDYGSNWSLAVFSLQPDEDGLANRCVASPPQGVYDTVADAHTNVYCTRVPVSYCEAFPEMCIIDPPDDKCFAKSFSSTTAQVTTCEGVLDELTCTPDTPGSTTTTTTYHYFFEFEVPCPPLDGGAQLGTQAWKSVDTSKPILFLRNQSGGVASGLYPIFGVARSDTQSSLSLTFMVDYQAVTLANLQTGIVDPQTCAEIPSSDCDAASSFLGYLDTTTLSDGHHVVTVSARAGDGSITYQDVEIEVSNGSGGSDGASFTADTIPSQMTTGESQGATISVKNTGTSTWTTDGCYRLGVLGGSDPFQAGNVRLDLPGGQSVAPNETAHFSFTMEAPSDEGSYTTDWRMIAQASCGGDGWFGPAFSREVIVSHQGTDGASFVSDSFPSQMGLGEVRQVSIQMRNTGTTQWTAEGCYKLGAVGGSDPFFPHNVRLSLPGGGPVNPGGVASFTMTLTAPQVESVYTSDWRMIAEASCGGGGWFGPTVSRDISVSLPAEIDLKVGGVTVTSGFQYTFPDSAINEPGVSEHFTLCNEGQGVLHIENADDLIAGPISSPFFQMSQPASYLEPGSCEAVEVRFSTTQAGEYQDRLLIYSNDADEDPFQIQLSGRRLAGRPLIRVEDSAGNPVDRGSVFTFPEAQAGAPISRLFQICNPGGVPLVLSNPGSLVSGNGFTQIGTPPVTEIGTDACSSFRVRFHVNSAGTYTGSVAIVSNVTPDPTFSFTVQGTAVNP